jgi:tetratricopeptide (TPR) repeat protein
MRNMGIEMSDFEKLNISSPRVLQMIAEIGFLASEYGLYDDAETIISCLVLARPENPFSSISIAVVYARSGRIQQAIDELKDAIVRFPDSEMAKALLGAFLVQAKQDGALELFNSVLETKRDRGALNIVECCMDLAKKLAKEKSENRIDSDSLEFFRHYNIRP